MATPADPLVIAGRQRDCWRFGGVLVGIGLVGAPVGAFLAAGVNDPSKPRPLAAAGFVLVMFAGAGAAHIMWCYFLPGRTRYVCDGQTLRAERGKRLVKIVQCSDIKTFWFSEPVTWSIITLNTGLPPAAPKLVVDTDKAGQGLGLGTAFPAIMLWGRQPIVDAIASLADATGIPTESGWE